jgi:predicted secreted protein
MPSIKITGKAAELWQGATPTKVGAVADFTYTVSYDSIDVSDHDSGGYKSKLAGMGDVKVSAHCWYLVDSSTGAHDSAQSTLSALAGGAPTDWYVRPNGTGAGKPQIKFSGVLRNKVIGAPLNAGINHDLEIEGYGAPDETAQSA